MGNILSETVQASDSSIVQQQSAVYNQLGQLFQSIGAENQTTEYSYDLNGNSTELLDARANPTTRAFDPLNRLKSVLDAKSGTTQYGYDTAGNLNTVIDPNGHTTTYTYDGLGNLTTLNSPDTGLTTYNSYDDAGNLLQETNANGIVIHYSYDELNRLTAIHYPDSTQDVYYYYDGVNYLGSDPTPANHAPIGQRTGMDDHSSRTLWYYNGHGDLIQQTQTLSASGQSYTLSYRYHTGSGLLSEITYPSGDTFSYAYNTQGQMQSILRNGEFVVNNIQYQPFGGIKSYDYGNGLNLTRFFDLDGRLSSQAVTGLVTVLDLSWNYNPVSSVVSINNLLDATSSQSFNYDELDRLNLAQTDASLYGLLGFNYDANGNRTQQDDNSQLINYLISSSSNLTDSTTGALSETFQYDAKGNITQRTINGITFIYEYNQGNRLSQITLNDEILGQ